MVNRGRSGACVTCKQRRVKCDEAKPECGPCQRLQLRCGGYKKKATVLKFKDQNHKFGPSRRLGRCLGNQSQVAILVPRPVAEPDTAMPFFLGHYASLGRYKGSARGFFELLIPVYRSQPQDSVFTLAVSTLASEILSLWQHGSSGLQLPQKSYTQAIIRLRSAIQDPAERGKPATILAALALQLYENIAAIFGFRLATCVHNNGAISLLPFVHADRENGVASAYIQRYMIHTETSSAMRQKRPLQKVARSWIASKVPTAVPANPSLTLDIIGASVAEFQAKYMQPSPEDGLVTPSQRALESKMEAKSIDERLLAWARSVPDHWHPLRFTSGQDFDPSIPAYESVCEVYPSCQIAAIWNLWRFQRLILVKIIFSSLNAALDPNQFQFANSHIQEEITDFVQCKRIIQELVDSVCYSVPFYLGNRTKPSSIADFTDPAVLLPSYHSLPLGDSRRLDNLNCGPVTTKDEHKRHAVAQGPWHAMSPLSRLLTLFSEDHGPLIASFLRPGQQDWIREQFLRTTTLFHLPQAIPSDRQEQYCLFNSSAKISGDAEAKYLARAVRKSSIFMSGP